MVPTDLDQDKEFLTEPQRRKNKIKCGQLMEAPTTFLKLVNHNIVLKTGARKNEQDGRTKRDTFKTQKAA